MTHARSRLWLLRTRGAHRGGGRILFYHRVSDDDDELAVAPATFARQMAWLAGAGLRAVDVGSLRRCVTAGAADGLVGLSFDDGYLDVADEAAHVLERYGFAATVFLATAVTDGRARFGWYGRQPPLMPWETVLRLDRDGPFRFEAHTRTHPNLLALGDAAARDEIAGGKAELEQRLARPVEGFCYPAGLFGARERRLAEQSGFAWAVSCEPGANDAETDAFALRRIQVDRRDSLLDFRAKALGGHDAPLPGRAAWRRLRYGAGSGIPRAASSRR